MTTQGDIAIKAGVSRATVSRVMNGDYNHRPGTVQRVLAAADEVGYTRPGTGEPSMASIAADLGISHASVQQALRDRRGSTTKVSPALVERVKARAAEVGYTPPPYKPRRRS